MHNLKQTSVAVLINLFIKLFIINDLGGTNCFDDVIIQQRGTFAVPSARQVIIPRASFNCDGRITGVTASMDRTDSGTTEPYLELWRFQTPISNDFKKVGEVQLAEAAVIQVGNDSSAYWFLNMSLNGNDRIEFEAGDAIGYFQPHDTHYRAWLIETDGYIVHAKILQDELNMSSNTFNLSSSDVSAARRQPLIQFLIGKNINYIHIV